MYRKDIFTVCKRKYVYVHKLCFYYYLCDRVFVDIFFCILPSLIEKLLSADLPYSTNPYNLIGLQLCREWAEHRSAAPRQSVQLGNLATKQNMTIGNIVQ